MKYQIGSAIVSGKNHVVLYCQGSYVDLSVLLEEPPSADGNGGPVSLMQIVQRWDLWKEKLRGIAEQISGSQEQDSLSGELKEEDIQWLPPLMYPSKLICIGANYTDHIAEMGFVPEQKYPYSFLKPATNTLIGHGETVPLPERAKMIDWEAELAIVIGRKAYNVRGEEAMASIAGYSIFNDVSARDWVEDTTFMGFDWIMLKAFDKSGPMGPLITPAEFVPDPQALSISLSINGEKKQDSNTANMVFSVQELVEHLSDFLTLEPGDVIATGTPAGVGFGRKPREFLKSGDRMLVEIEGLGCLENPVE